MKAEEEEAAAAEGEVPTVGEEKAKPKAKAKPSRGRRGSLTLLDRLQTSGTAHPARGWAVSFAGAR